MKSKALAILAFFIILPLFLKAEVFESKRKVLRSFKATDKTSLSITNKYGNIHMVPWKKDSVRFEISISVSGSKAVKVEKVDKDISFEFTNTRYYIVARTIFGTSMSSLWSDLSDMTSTIFSSGAKATINYTVYFPEGSAVKLDNKFGNIYTTNHIAKTEIILSNGDFKAHDLLGDVDIFIQFGDGSANKISKGSLELAYGEFDFNELGNIEFIGKSAELTIGEVGFLRLDSRRDKIRIKKLGGLSGFAAFSTVSIDYLTDEALVSTQYGEIYVTRLGDAFRLLDLTSEFTDIIIKNSSSNALDADIFYDDRTQLTLTEEFRKMKPIETGDEFEMIRKTGKTAATAARYSKIRIKLYGGSLEI